MADDDPLTAELDRLNGIHREITLVSGEKVCDSDRHKWPCHAHVLLGVVDEVLKQADEWNAKAGKLHSAVTEDPDANAATQAARSMIASTRQVSAQEVREAITRALTGEAGDG